MDIDLKTSWQETISDFISPDVTLRHLRDIEAESKDIEALVHCYLYDGLFDGAPIDKPQVNADVLNLLEALERAGRNIVLINTAASYGEEQFAKAVPDKDWKFLPRLSTGQEFFQRASKRYETPKAELLISPRASLEIDNKAHITRVHPLKLMN